MNEAAMLFEDAFGWLRERYATFQFFAERDIVWTVQTRIIRAIKQRGLPHRVFNDYGILPGERRSLSADLAIINRSGDVEVAAEFKYEPSHQRDDIPQTKFPVVFWGSDGVGKDVQRVHEFVTSGRARVAYAVFIDEGGYFRHRPAHAGSEWIEFGGEGPWVLWSRVGPSP